MRTSRTSKDSAKLWQTLSPPPRRQTRQSHNPRTATSLRSFAFNDPSATRPVKEPPGSSDDASSLSSVDTVDMEDILERPLKRRRSNAVGMNSHSTRSPGKKIAGKTERNGHNSRTPRKPKGADSSIKLEPPPNWDKIYDTVKKMRQNNPTAPVDTVGCAELYWRGSSPRDKRFQTLIALMLSSQTKDTVTAVAMERLHTELGENNAPAERPIVKVEDEDESKSKAFKDSTLNLENILAVSPERLNELIRAVGFHNNKTKYIKATATTLRDQHDSDIPATPKELMALPGVGPKMAYLCMSAAWGKHEGIGVDVHVHRITNLWGWHKTKTPEETRAALESWLPKDKWHEINKLLVGLGQTVCSPVGRRCDECDLSGTGLCKGEVKAKPKKPSRSMVKKEASVEPLDSSKESKEQ